MHPNVSARWQSTASLDDLAASALGVLGLRGGSGGRGNSSAAAPGGQYRYPVGNHGRRAAKCALRRDVVVSGGGDTCDQYCLPRNTVQ